MPDARPPRPYRIVTRARERRQDPGLPREWTPVLDVHPTAYRPDPLPGYAWLQLPDRIREVSRGYLEFWYDPPRCALTDEELDLLRRLAAADVPVMFQARRVTARPPAPRAATPDRGRDLHRPASSRCPGARTPAR